MSSAWYALIIDIQTPLGLDATRRKRDAKKADVDEVEAEVEAFVRGSCFSMVNSTKLRFFICSKKKQSKY